MTVQNENPDLFEPIQPVNEMKKWLVNYVGEKINPDNDEVNVEMIIQVMATEFPEFLLAIAEENFIRGYQQGLSDADLSASDALPSALENGALGYSK
tara:strand:+ start:629 stop:919 length:291 start_codon:yes stop_codon:yes gene_type:complete